MSVMAVNTSNRRNNIFHERDVLWAQDCEMDLIGINMFQLAKSQFFVNATYMTCTKWE